MKKYFEKLYKGSASDFHNQLKIDLENDNKRFIITANPEAFMHGTQNETVDRMLTDSEVTTVADGIGLVKGAKMLDIDITERVPGVEIAEKLMEYGNELKKSIFLFGAKQEVIDAMLKVIAEKYPNLSVAGSENGYVADKDAVFERIAELKPDIVLVALGMPTQELLIYKHLERFEKGIFVGVGGSFDVLSGTKQRAPEFFIKHNLEWFYRIAKEPKRIKRFYDNNVKFLFKIKKMK